MLIISLALHVSVATGIGLSYLWTAAMPTTASSDATMPAVMLLHSQETPNLHSRPPASAKSAARTIATSLPATVPSPAQPITEKALTALARPPAPETNPNSHVRTLPPEAILSPNPAPHLNGADGVVFILDISGSMYEPYAGSTRLTFARETLSRRIGALKDGTPFAVTLYAQNAYTSGPLVAANDATREAAVRFIMQDVDCGGGTNLPAGLASAEQLHAGAFVLVSDGDLNISATSLTTKADGILGPKGHCPELTIVGIAPRSNTRDERLLQGLADQQGGTYLAEQFEGQTSLITSASSAIKPTSVTP